MKKIISHTCILLVLITLGLAGMKTGSLVAAIVFFVILIPYVILLTYIGLFLKPSERRNNKIIPYSGLQPEVKDTSGWEHKRAIIQQYTPGGNVEDKGTVIGKIFHFMVEIDDDNGSRWKTLIKNKFIPLEHLGSFGKFSEVMVCYNPNQKYEAIFDPENENWHYEKK